MSRSYKRYLLIFIFGIIISVAIDIIVQFDNEKHNRLYDMLLSVFLTLVIWEGNKYLDDYFNRRLPWTNHTLVRVLIQLPLSMLFSVTVIYLAMTVYNNFVCALPDEVRSVLFTASIIVGTLFSIILLTVEISMQFFTNWKQSLVEVEKYKAESLQAQLSNLKNQVNPHFLFNNMSVLSSLVYKDQDKAVEFINRLSKVYRYLLDNKDSELVSLSNELQFINSYIYLLEVRFGNNIRISISIDENKLKTLIPPMALQMLIENGIKHNEVSEQKPLDIKVYIEGNYLCVKNNLQLKTQHEESSKTGLQNIQSRYRYFTDQLIHVSQNDAEFIVKLPLIHQQ